MGGQRLRRDKKKKKDLISSCEIKIQYQLAKDFEQEQKYLKEQEVLKRKQSFEKQKNIENQIMNNNDKL